MKLSDKIAMLLGFIAALTIFTVMFASEAARAEQSLPVVTSKHGVLQSSTLKDCRHTQQVPCSLFDGLDSGWLERNLDGSYTWHPVWMHGPRGQWHWATKFEQQRYGLTMMNQVKRRHGEVTWFRGPTGERWANVPGTDSEHQP